MSRSRVRAVRVSTSTAGVLLGGPSSRSHYSERAIGAGEDENHAVLAPDHEESRRG